MSCDVGKAMEGLENELWRRWNDGKVGEWALPIPFRHFTYVTTHSPTLPSLYLRHSSFSNPSVASPTSQFILQLLFLFSYVTSSSLTSPGEPTMLTGIFEWFSSVTKANAGLDFHCHDPFDHYSSIIKFNQLNLTKKHQLHNNIEIHSLLVYIQKILEEIWPRCWSVSK